LTGLRHCGVERKTAPWRRSSSLNNIDRGGDEGEEEEGEGEGENQLSFSAKFVV
jgi:hypothetical protein